MSRIGQGSGLSAPTTFASRLKRPTGAGAPVAAQSAQAATQQTNVTTQNKEIAQKEKASTAIR